MAQWFLVPERVLKMHFASIVPAIVNAPGYGARSGRRVRVLEGELRMILKIALHRSS